MDDLMELELGVRKLEVEYDEVRADNARKPTKAKRARLQELGPELYNQRKLLREKMQQVGLRTTMGKVD